MIEWRAFEAHPIVSERFQEINDFRALLRIQADVADSRPEIATRRHVTVPSVKLHHLVERGGPTGMEIRPRQLDVAQPRRLERSDGRPSRCAREQRRSKCIQPCSSGVTAERTHSGPEEPKRTWIDRVTVDGRRD